MSDLMALFPNQNGFLSRLNSYRSPHLCLNPNISEIKEENWIVAEKATRGVIDAIQPTVASEKKRQEVIEYMQKLFRCHLNCEVFSFGSVPLKTYLPDGDIDLTAFGFPSVDALASNAVYVLEIEEKNHGAEFEVRDVHYIHAEVKLVKCRVRDIVVDISFNQSGGLSTLCFLEQVDRLIGKNHLFKRSIILIKAWCYYESRTLGAQHGLISTYALETLVLYIFHLFHLSLNGPLMVLYKFLDYYSKFDWDRYCMSLNGPVSLLSLQELLSEVPENDKSDLLFTKEFLKNCVDNFSVPSRTTEKFFPQKHLNIVDLLKENNNLGRSVNKGNFYRIRGAFAFGAKKLGEILLLRSENITEKVNAFFENILTRVKIKELNENTSTLELFDSEEENESEFSSSESGFQSRSDPMRLADLIGNFDAQIRNLLYVQGSREYISGNFFPNSAQQTVSRYSNKNEQELSRVHDVYPLSGTYPRCTGTYLPNPDYHAYRDQQLGRGENPMPQNNHFSRHHDKNNNVNINQNIEMRGGHEPPSPHLQLPMFIGNSGSNAASIANSPFELPSEELEFGSFGSLQETYRKLDSLNPSASACQRPLSNSSYERHTDSYKPKDEDDFPPL